MVRRLLAAILSAAIVLLSPGLEAGSAVAAVIAPKSAVPSVNLGAAGAVAAPRLQVLGAVSLQAPSLAPSALTAPALNAAVLAPPLAAAPAAPAEAPRAAASLPQMSAALVAPLAAAHDGNAPASAGHASARQIEDVITGARSIEGAGDASVAGGFAASPVFHAEAASFLSAPADAPKPAAAPAPEAPKAPAVKVVSSRAGYALHRFLLSAVAALTGAVHSLPAAGPALSARAIKAAADKKVVISDYDDTLAAYNQVLGPEMIEAVRAVKAAGKHFVVISDRGDEKRAHQLTVFESLETLPVELRAGMYVAANSGGRVYRYDEKGVPQRVFEVPALENEKKALVSEAAAATKERMKALGAEQHDPVKSGNNNPSESWNTYGYAMMLKVGSSEAQVRGAAEIMQEELAARGIEAEVNPRFAKDPANPPYINFSIVTKQPATAYIAKALGAAAKDVVLVGDSQYVPKEAKKQGSFLDRLGARLAGRAMPKTGNATDRNMEKALPGALVIAVGHNADPRMRNAWVTDVKGPESTRRMLLSVASKKAGAPRETSAAEDVMALVAFLGIAALGVGAAYLMLSAVAEIFVQGEQLLRQQSLDPFDGAFLLGAGGLLLGSLKSSGAKKDEDPSKKVNEDKPISRVERVLTGVLLAAAVGGSLYLWYLLYAGFGALTPAPVEVPPGWQGPIPNVRGIEDLFQGAGLGGLLVAGTLATTASIRSGLSKVKEFLRPAFPFLAWLGLAALTVAIYAGFFWAASHAPVATPAVPVAPAGWERLFSGGIGFLGLGGAMLGMGMMTRPALLDNPGDAYAEALGSAMRVAAQRGVKAEQVLFVQATAVMPLHQGKQWHYQFALPRADGRHDLVYVDFERNLTAVDLDHRVSVYENTAVLPEGAVSKALTPYLLARRGVLRTPQQALDALRAAHPGFGTSVSVALRLEQTEDLDAWYRFYDNNGAQAAVNARTAEIRVAVAPQGPAPKQGLSGTAKFLIVAALAALAYALIVGQLATAAGFALAAGAIKKTGKVKVADEDIRATASYVISYKGRPWSSTEFNSVYYPALEQLKAKGATKRQVALFEKLVADAPIKGGSFNPWSGD